MGEWAMVGQIFLTTASGAGEANTRHWRLAGPLRKAGAECRAVTTGGAGKEIVSHSGEALASPKQTLNNTRPGHLTNANQPGHRSCRSAHSDLPQSLRQVQLQSLGSAVYKLLSRPSQLPVDLLFYRLTSPEPFRSPRKPAFSPFTVNLTSAAPPLRPERPDSALHT